VIGGCCGTTPEHIEKTVALCKDFPVRLPDKKNRTQRGCRCAQGQDME